MSSITQISRLSNYLVGSYKSVLHTRTKWSNSVQICCYTKKSAEDRLGIEKPKRPLTPFFKFMTQMRPALLAKNPGISSKEATLWISKHWQELDSETKTQMVKEFEKDQEDYKKIKAMYESSLTEQQKEDIKRVKAEMTAAKEKRKLKAELKEMGKPKKPMSSYFLFSQTKKELFQGHQNMKENQERIKTAWLKLPESERVKYEKQAQALMEKYKKDMEAWELKMISIGRTDLVRVKDKRQSKKAKDVQSIDKQTCSDAVSNPDNLQKSTSIDLSNSIQEVKPKVSIDRQSTGETKTEQIQSKSKQSHQKTDTFNLS
ncbi:transcription factor A, mitochondrial-like isoform X2 [Battus philenor]|uniref:transcription factor A, mitochondrial-like isoform X2 n=1 Tax=Battus philenor TaxID=42288 RepID=UPI0035CFB39C